MAENDDNYRAWRLHGPGDLRLDTIPVPPVAPDGVLARVRATVVLKYVNTLYAGKLDYAFPDLPFVPGAYAVGEVLATGSEVTHVSQGERVYLSGIVHGEAREEGEDSPVLLIGTTRFGDRFADLLLQRRWPNGPLGEIAHWPARATTSLRGLEKSSDVELLALGKVLVPYGAFERLPDVNGRTVAVNGASGVLGSFAVLMALTLGARRVVVVGRNHAALAKLVGRFGDRVVPVVLSGDPEADPSIIRDAAGGPVFGAVDLLGQAASTASTLATLRSLRRGGRLVLMGSAKVPLEISFGELLANNWEVVGQLMYSASAPKKLAGLLAEGKLDLSAITTQSFALEDFAAAGDAAACSGGFEQTALVL